MIPESAMPVLGRISRNMVCSWVETILSYLHAKEMAGRRVLETTGRFAYCESERPGNPIIQRIGTLPHLWMRSSAVIRGSPCRRAVATII